MNIQSILIKAATALALMASATAPALAAYPDKPIVLVVPYPPGGVADTVSRTVAERLAQRLGQSVLIENKPGAKQIIGADMVAKSAPDGYTLFLGSITSLSLNPASGVKTPYNVQRDFAPVTRFFHAPLLLVTNDGAPGKSVKDLIAYVKGHPGKLSYASIGPGSSTHIAAELFKQMAGLDIVHIPYKGSAPAINALLGGQVQMFFDAGTSALPHVRAGKLNLLAVTTSKRFAYLPDVPTMAESGLHGYDVTPWWGIVAPAGTPAAILERLSEELQAITSSKDLRDRFGKNGVALEGSTPAEFAAFIDAETKKWTSFIHTSGIKLGN